MDITKLLKPVGARPQLPPSDDPKIQARREKARIYAQKKRDEAKQVKAPAKKEDTNLLHNLPEDIQKKIMAMAKKVWDDEGVSVNSYTMNEKDFRNFGFITYMTKREDPDGQGWNNEVDNIIERSKEENKGKVLYKWTYEKVVKNEGYKKMMISAKRKISKYKDWDKKNGRMIMFFLGKENATLITYVGDINKKDDDVFKATFGKIVVT